MKTPAGRVEIDGAVASLHFERQLAHPPDVVWDALTDPEQLRGWFLTEATIDGRPGGSVDMVSGTARFHWTGRILTWDPPRVLEYAWKTPPQAYLPQGEDTVVRWELSPSAGGTLLRLTHSRLTRPTALGFAPGTHVFLDRLAAHLDGTSMPAWQPRYDEVKGDYPQWSR